MKKEAALVLSLGLLGAVAFAQSSGPSLEFHGYMNYGMSLVNNGSGTNLLAYGSDSGIDVGRFQLDATYTADSWGLVFRLRDDSPSMSGPASQVYFRRAYGWVDILNGLITLQAGVLGDYSWDSNNFQHFGTLDGDMGVQVQLKPLIGLNFGAFLPTALNGTFENPFENSNGTPGAWNNMVVGGRYDFMDVGYLSAGYSFGGEGNINAIMTTLTPYLWAGFGYTGSDQLTAKAELAYTNSSVAGNNYFYADEQLGYTSGATNLVLYAEEQLNRKALDGTSAILHLQPSIDYTYDIFDIGAFFSFLTDGTSSGYGPGAWLKTNVAKSTSVVLGAEYDLGSARAATSQPGSYWGRYMYWTGNYDPFGGPFQPNALATQSNNEFRAYLDFVWSF